MTKYGHLVGDALEEDEDESEPESPTSVKSHDVDVILTTDPTEDMGYGREKYTAHLAHDDDEGSYVVYFTKHRWKGNYWREAKEYDWQDVPYSVKKQVSEVVACDGVSDLDPEVRLIDEGGESTWRDTGDENV